LKRALCLWSSFTAYEYISIYERDEYLFKRGRGRAADDRTINGAEVTFMTRTLDHLGFGVPTYEAGEVCADGGVGDNPSLWSVDH
jgi:hypothetical protein